MRQELVQCPQPAIELCGGATESLFPDVEERLLAETETQEALFFVTGNKDIGRYRSLMDFLFCETFPEHRSACMRFYGGTAPPLRGLIADLPEWRHYRRVMLHALEFAKAAHRRGRKINWCWFVGTLKRAVRDRQN